ncbi:MAG TPA: hypothetical protein VFX77_08515 [Rubrobacter sp.]|nr:hypothetical protein [Rubrobacter sp.]
MTQPPDPTAVRMRLLGSFRVFVGSRTVEESGWRLKKAAGLVKLLALAPDHRLHREQFTEALWPGQGRRMASNSFRQALYIARRTLDPDAAVASRLRRIELRETLLSLLVLDNCEHVVEEAASLVDALLDEQGLAPHRRTPRFRRRQELDRRSRQRRGCGRPRLGHLARRFGQRLRIW